MDFSTGSIYHVYNRTNGGRTAFFSDRNFRYFRAKIFRHIVPHASVFAYCLMPTHFHLLLMPRSTDGTTAALNLGIGISLRSYTRALQNQQRFTGSLFQQHTRARLADDYAVRYFHYIHQHPLVSGHVESIDEWPYSSYHEYVRPFDEAICDVEFGREVLGLPHAPTAFATCMRQATPCSIPSFNALDPHLAISDSGRWRDG